MATRRQYITEADVEEYSDISVTDSSEAEDRMNLAEVMVDSYVGFITKHIRGKYSGQATSGSNDYIIDISGDSPLNDYDDDYFTYCEVEIIGGTGKGQVRTISSHEPDSSKITVNEDWSTNPNSTSFYVIRQLGKFPRPEDVYQNTDNKYFKQIPDAVKQATLSQFEYIVEKGDDFFAGAVDYSEEELGDYKYKSKDKNRALSPQARQIIKPLVNRKGRMIV